MDIFKAIIIALIYNFIGVPPKVLRLLIEGEYKKAWIVFNTSVWFIIPLILLWKSTTWYVTIVAFFTIMATNFFISKEKGD